MEDLHESEEEDMDMADVWLDAVSNKACFFLPSNEPTSVHAPLYTVLQRCISKPCRVMFKCLSLFVKGTLNVQPRRESTTSYFEFLSKNEHDIRNLVEHVAIFYDRLTIFERCAQCYSNCLATVRVLGPRFLPSHILFLLD